MLAIAKVADDVLLTGTRRDIEKFHEGIGSRWSVHVDMREYMATIRSLELGRHRRKHRDTRCTREEINAFLGLTGSLNSLGHGILPKAAFAASHLQQLVGHLRVADLENANKSIADIEALDPCTLYQWPRNLDEPSYLAFSDAIQGKTAYGQTGYVSGVYLPAG